MSVVSRREFLKGAGAVAAGTAALAAMGVSAFAADEADAVTGASLTDDAAVLDAGTASGAASDWRIPPAPIDEIKSKQEALMKAMEPVATEMYQSAQANQAAGGAGTPPPGQEPPKSEEPKKQGGDDVVDADFTMK